MGPNGRSGVSGGSYRFLGLHSLPPRKPIGMSALEVGLRKDTGSICTAF